MLIFKGSQVIKYYVMFAFLFVQTVFDYDRPVRPALRERFCTHKVLIKRTAFYLNYLKLSHQ